MKRGLFPPNANPTSKKKNKKSESQAHSLRSHLQPDSVIISTLKCLLSQSQSSSSSSETLNLPELDGIVVRKKLVSVVGRLIFTEKNGSKIDCSKIDIVVPSPPYVDSIGDFSSDALFILLVECDDTFMQLADIKFYDRFPCIMITSGGHLDSQTGIFLTRLKMELNLPVLALVDSDPRGFEILSRISHTTNSSTLDVKWMGMRPSDLDKYQIPEDCRLPMTDQDMKAAKNLLKEDFVKRNQGWVKELQMMVKTRQKAEIMALCSFGLQYLTEVYLPLKLQQQDWL